MASNREIASNGRIDCCQTYSSTKRVLEETLSR
ncbi:predicted protein [Sclerotinia sclerotiorum 1980 UF-70]|uniref:Uncharacterized protein n=1 Tax=Sclerotinia sclerotiorum (strain ATCC 18683 / 1980 / Ss-1) TaxID=665079 RepID=A7E9F5_SCLS1|nr:predicted protein [Sclerotinia sclerotiorum 1980 UF-70]EDN97007.1 predicted protein [Sclerotinia sclerotiorum 1980 UF-70]